MPWSFSPASSLLQRVRTTKEEGVNVAEEKGEEEREEEGEGKEENREETGQAGAVAKEKAIKVNQEEEQEGTRTLGTSKKTLHINIKAVLLLF